MRLTNLTKTEAEQLKKEMRAEGIRVLTCCPLNCNDQYHCKHWVITAINKEHLQLAEKFVSKQ